MSRDEKDIFIECNFILKLSVTFEAYPSETDNPSSKSVKIDGKTVG